MKKRPNIMMLCSPACCILMLAGLLSLSSCSSYEDDDAAHAKGDVTLSFAMAVDGGATTRSMKGDDAAAALTAYWEKGEQVTVAITHDGTTTYKDATVNQISNDKKRAYVSMTVDADKVATGDKITVIYPAIGSTGEGVINFTKQDGSLNGDLGVSKFDLRHGESTVVVEGTTATLAADLGLAADLTAYIGAKCVDSEGHAIEVKEMTVRPADGDDSGEPAWYNWKTRASFSADGIATDYWGGIIATRDAGSTDSIYIAMPVANSGQKMVFTAITADDKVYAVTKTWTGEAGGYYPVKFTMTEVPTPTPVDLGLTHKWGSRDVGAPNDVDAVGTAYAYGEITARNGHNVKYADQSLPDTYADGWIWKYDFQHTPYQTNPNATSRYNSTTWSKYAPDPAGESYPNLEACDDPASMLYGTNWKTPDINDMAEIYNAIVDEKLTQNVQYGGIIVTSPTTGGSITLLNTQYRYNSTLYGRNSSTLTLYRWTATASKDWPGIVYALRFNHNVDYTRIPQGVSYATYFRCVGCPIRPVYTK